MKIHTLPLSLAFWFVLQCSAADKGVTVLEQAVRAGPDIHAKLPQAAKPGEFCHDYGNPGRGHHKHPKPPKPPCA